VGKKEKTCVLSPFLPLWQYFFLQRNLSIVLHILNAYKRERGWEVVGGGGVTGSGEHLGGGKCTRRRIRRGYRKRDLQGSGKRKKWGKITQRCVIFCNR